MLGFRHGSPPYFSASLTLTRYFEGGALDEKLGLRGITACVVF